MPVVPRQNIRGAGTRTGCRRYSSEDTPRRQQCPHVIGRIPASLRRPWRAQPKGAPLSSAQGLRGEFAGAPCACFAYCPLPARSGARGTCNGKLLVRTANQERGIRQRRGQVRQCARRLPKSGHSGDRSAGVRLSVRIQRECGSTLERTAESLGRFPRASETVDGSHPTTGITLEAVARIAAGGRPSSLATPKAKILTGFRRPLHRPGVHGAACSPARNE